MLKFMFELSQHVKQKKNEAIFFSDNTCREKTQSIIITLISFLSLLKHYITVTTAPTTELTLSHPGMLYSNMKNYQKCKGLSTRKNTRVTCKIRSFSSITVLFISLHTVSWTFPVFLFIFSFLRQ